MKTKEQMLKELRDCKAEYVTYGDGDLGMAIPREEAIQDVEGMDEDSIGEGTWYPMEVSEAELDGADLVAECTHCGTADAYVSTGEHTPHGTDIVRCSSCAKQFPIKW